MTNLPANADTAVVAEKYRAVADYEPQHHDEIKLTLGNQVIILHAYDDGWVLGQNETTNAIGLLPRNFLALMGSEDASKKKETPYAVKRTSSFMHTSVGKMSLAQPSDASSIHSSSSQNHQQQQPQQQQQQQRQDHGQTSEPSQLNRTPTSASQKGRSRAGSRPAPMTDDNRATSPSPSRGPPSGIKARSQSLSRPALEKSQGSALPHSALAALRAAMDTPRSPATSPEAEEERRQAATKKLATVTMRRSVRAKVPANIGSLRVAVVGDSGIGKTSLIQNFLGVAEVQFAETFTPSETIQEVRASTIPTNELHTGEDPLNVTFVDTPGFGISMDAMETIQPIVDYHLKQFQQTDDIFARDAPIPTLVNFLNSGTGAHTHVDVCIFGILHRLKPVDIEFMRRLTPYVNIVPVIVKCDTLKPTELFQLKVSVLEGLGKAGIPIYGFGLDFHELIDLARAGVSGAPPFAISNPDVASAGSTPTPGIVNEFESLKNNILYHHIDDLRQLTAERFAEWRERNRRDMEAAAAKEREMRMKSEREARAAFDHGSVGSGTHMGSIGSNGSGQTSANKKKGINALFGNGPGATVVGGNGGPVYTYNNNQGAGVRRTDSGAGNGGARGKSMDDQEGGLAGLASSLKRQVWTKKG
ncbi:hypothetical protein HDV00_006769 [Rhizophlyctis rosea]|nr:hypothetical protein HDV00_006769 [Rhizophlyctis rosea]